jgi:hypothetical protein
MINHHRVEACYKVNRLNKNKSSLNIKIIEKFTYEVYTKVTEKLLKIL